jgi:hypothetical protein
MDAVWLMGVWERSPMGKDISSRNGELMASFSAALPDYKDKDNVGSAYCIRRYEVDEHLGGAKGLAAARQALAKRGIRLVLDFVPNHVAPDHPWAAAHPEYFIQGTPDDVRTDPAAFMSVNSHVLANGRDPYFPPWPDVLQLNAFSPALRSAASETISAIAAQCDGVRCDMAMLFLNDIFERTWAGRTGARPDSEYWTEVIGAARQGHPGFLFMAEAYWDLEWSLQQLGFDYCYDKRLYDRMEHDDAESVRLHLLADLSYQEKLVRFIENHDEPRAATVFPREKERAAIVIILTLPGARLLHEGQLEGRKVRVPVFLSRRPDEPPDRELEDFSRNLLAATAREPLRSGTWSLCDRRGWPDNRSFLNILAWCWEKEDARTLVVVNFSGTPSQTLVRTPWEDLRGKGVRLEDRLTGEAFDRPGDEVAGNGLFVSLPAWKWHFLDVRPTL